MPYTNALAAFRRRSLTPETDEVLPAVFVLEPRMYASAAVVAAWAPVSTLQVLGGAACASDTAVRATIEHAIVHLGARAVVVCAEEATPPQHGAAAEALLRACGGLLEDDVLGPLLHARGVGVEALWFDGVERDLHLWSTTQRRFELLSDEGVVRFLARISARGSSDEQRRAD